MAGSLGASGLMEEPSGDGGWASAQEGPSLGLEMWGLRTP